MFSAPCICILLLSKFDTSCWQRRNVECIHGAFLCIITIRSICLSVSAILLYYCTSKYLTSHSQEFKLFFCIIIFFSNILLFNVIERGGLTLYISIFLLLSLHLKDTNSKYKRELALIFIAIAAGIKIYPAIFGLIYIIEKRYKEAARLVIYGLISFFYPSYFLVDIMDSCSFYPSRICYNYPALVQQQPPCHIFFFL